jgi:hypothetical protein
MLENTRDHFIAATKDAWIAASQFSHPTSVYLQEKLAARAAGITPGFETVEQFTAGVDHLFETESIVVVLALHAIQQDFAGDVLVEALDRQDSWPFHESPFVSDVDAFFDYKFERQDKLDEIRQRREERLKKGPGIRGIRYKPRK